MEITVLVKEVYGVERFYPVCETAKRFATLIGKKTLDRVDLRIIGELGYKILVKSACILDCVS